MKRVISYAAAIGALALFIGCADTATTPSSETTPTPDPVESTIVFADGDAVSAYLGTGTYTNAVSGTGDGAVTWSSDAPSLASVDAATGAVTPIAAGDAVIRASKEATATHTAVSATYALTVKTLALGEAYQGGVVVYFLQSGDPGYDANLLHGLVAAPAYLEGTVPWALVAYETADVSGAYGAAIGDGKANTAAIVAQNGAGTGYAAGLCDQYANADTGTGSYDDWFLPSEAELAQLLAAAGSGFIDMPDYYYGNGPEAPPSWSYSYWTSTGVSASQARRLTRADDSFTDLAKSAGVYVHPVRSF